MFTVTRQLSIVPCALAQLATGAGQTRNAPVDRTEDCTGGPAWRASRRRPQPGDAVLFGLSAAVPRCAVLLRVDVHGRRASGSTRATRRWVWEAWDGDGWVDLRGRPGHHRRLQHGRATWCCTCRPTHAASVVGQAACGLAALPDDRAGGGPAVLRRSPRPAAVTASTIGGTALAPCTPRSVSDEVVGVSEGRARPAVPAARRPVVAGDGPLLVEVDRRRRLGRSGARSRRSPSPGRGRPALHARPGVGRGRVRPGRPPAGRRPAPLRRGSAEGARSIRVPQYRTGGGRSGNVARAHCWSSSAIRVPFVSSVVNRHRARRRGRRRVGRGRGRPRVRCCCAQWNARSPPRTTSSSPARPRPRSRGCGVCRTATASVAIRVLVVPDVSDHRRVRS